MKRVLWVGGPPGSTLGNIARKMRADGIELVDTSNTAKEPPSWADAVLVNVDMLDHNAYDRQKILCANACVPFVVAHLSYTRTRSALLAAGLIDLNHAVEASLAGEQEPTMPSIDPSADLETQRQQLRALLLGLPPALRTEAAAAVEDLRRLDEDERLRPALEALEAALDAVADDALVRNLTLVSKRNRDRLHTAIGLAEV